MRFAVASPILAIIEGLDSIPSSRSLTNQYGPLLTQIILILSLGLGIGIVGILLVKFAHRSHRRRSSSGPLPSTGRHRHSGRRKRIRRTEHRPRMPTLSETGGLPPMRPEEPPNPSPSP